jgi:hypothetical protein
MKHDCFFTFVSHCACIVYCLFGWLLWTSITIYFTFIYSSHDCILSFVPQNGMSAMYHPCVLLDYRSNQSKGDVILMTPINPILGRYQLFGSTHDDILLAVVFQSCMWLITFNKSRSFVPLHSFFLAVTTITRILWFMYCCPHTLHHSKQCLICRVTEFFHYPFSPSHVNKFTLPYHLPKVKKWKIPIILTIFLITYYAV